MRAAIRIAMVSAWLAVVWAAAPLAHVRSEAQAVVVPLIVVSVGAVLVALERLGAGVIGIVLTVTAVWLLAAATWGVLAGTVLLVSGIAVLVGGYTETP
ncbi:hypothetical protein HNP84_009786 [Thermocatellispora tengchongensis]|uniref:Uncharacterized protein n=1 Tax=Thermocatellispora tengchongensis TaxID=1073253 RepID=A0A840PQH3_9ACTN|nr:hypothetical protein [Thermocatellispora tengchongensis]MBB5140021.1 hypothetical protein [Thermocatellispora tengchongensis]